MLEAITTSKRRVERTMKAFHRELAKQMSGTSLTVMEPEISKPRVAGGFATMAARFAVDDGQSVSVIFHSPSGDPKKIVDEDVLIAFRFLLNKQDVTPTVSPAGGRDVSLKQVTLKLSNLIEKNSENFKNKLAANKAKQDELETIQAEIDNADTEAKGIEEQIELMEGKGAEVSQQAKSFQIAVKKKSKRVDELKSQLAKLETQKKAEQAKTSDNAKSTNGGQTVDLTKQMMDKLGRGGGVGTRTKGNDGGAEVKPENPTKPEVNQGINPVVGDMDFTKMYSNRLMAGDKSFHDIGLEDPDLLIKDITDASLTKEQKEKALSKAMEYKAYKATQDALGETGSGELHWYGLRARPATIGAVPDDMVSAMDAEKAKEFHKGKDRNNALRHGAIAYDRKLTKEEISQYELVDLAEQFNPDDVELLHADIEAFRNELIETIESRYDDLNEDAINTLEMAYNSKPASFFNKFIRNFDEYVNRKQDKEGYQRLNMYRQLLADRKGKHSAYIFAMLKANVKTKKENVIVKRYEKTLSNLETSLISNDADGIQSSVETFNKDIETFKGIHSVNRLAAAPLRAMLNRLYAANVPYDSIPHDVMAVIDKNAIQSDYLKDNLDPDAEEFGRKLARGLAEQEKRDMQELKDEQAAIDKKANESATVNDNNDEPETDSITQTVNELKAALDNEQDADVLMDMLEKAIDELEAADAYEENEQLIELVSERISELLEAQV